MYLYIYIYKYRSKYLYQMYIHVGNILLRIYNESVMDEMINGTLFYISKHFEKWRKRTDNMTVIALLNRVINRCMKKL